MRAFEGLLRKGMHQLWEFDAQYRGIRATASGNTEAVARACPSI
jgi:hypothetical protein